MLYIINTVKKEIVAEIMANHSMCLDEAINLVGEFVTPEYDDDANVIINGNEYWYEELEITGNPDAYFAEA